MLAGKGDDGSDGRGRKPSGQVAGGLAREDARAREKAAKVTGASGRSIQRAKAGAPAKASSL
jgi:hypothetical protein